MINVPMHSHVIQLTGTIFELDSSIKETNILSKFHENWAKNVTSHKNAPPTGGHVLSPIPTIFKLPYREYCHYIHIEKDAPPTGGHVFFYRSRPFSNLSETSIDPIVFTRKTAPPTGGHVFQRIRTTFELNQDIIKTNILTNFELGRDFIRTKLLTNFMKIGL
ncbi:hypothetical protein DPMN_052219 [Dreissena polymorpha]|uniref:Uncharacterized protein n=1 Tax=Dreissena polymorpha TaxID=45954 RepID=A0A9D4HMU6_DREPO|nr:hypothetical protein DPMN_052219 [Dreissena polymorpha]